MARKQMPGKCRLCLREGMLVDSHIIPNFYFKQMKGEENKYFVLSNNPEKREVVLQRGITEYLLCADCDNVCLSSYENHLSQVLFSRLDLDKYDSGIILTVEGYDYRSIKNGLLSILWRMSVCKHPYFSGVCLGQVHEENLRVSLLNKSEIPEQRYPIMVTAPFIRGKPLGHCIAPPDFTRVANNRVYRCLISGLIFTFVVGSAPLDSRYKGTYLRKKQWPIIRAEVDRIPFLFDAMQQLYQAMRTRETAKQNIAA